MSLYDNLEFRHLKYIVAIAEAGTFTAAAVRIPVAQSALSRQIKEIEDTYKFRLFDRDRDGSSMTPAGEALLGFARYLLQTRVDIIETIRAIHDGTLLPLRLGFSPFVDRHLLGTVCEAYRALFPKSDILPESGDTEELLEHLSDGTLDAALVTLPVSDEHFCIQEIMHERLMVCVRTDDPLAELAAIAPKLMDGKLGVFSDPRLHPKAHARLLEMLKEARIAPRVCAPTFNSEHVQWMVKEKLCYALIGERMALQSGLTARPIIGVDWTIDSALVYKPGDAPMTVPMLARDLERQLLFSDKILSKKPSSSETRNTARQEILRLGEGSLILRKGRPSLKEIAPSLKSIGRVLFFPPTVLAYHG